MPEDENKINGAPIPAMTVMQPQPTVWASLTPEERSLITSKNDTPDEYAAMILPSTGFSLGFADVAPGVKAVVIQVLVIVPPGILPADASVLVDPQTKQPHLSKRLAEAMPAGWPLVTRCLVKRSSLSPEIQKRLAATDELAAIAALTPQNQGTA